jgi:hypothetical protein
MAAARRKKSAFGLADVSVPMPFKQPKVIEALLNDLKANFGIHASDADLKFFAHCNVNDVSFDIREDDECDVIMLWKGWLCKFLLCCILTAALGRTVGKRDVVSCRSSRQAPLHR